MRYAQRIPCYRRFANEQGLSGPVELDVIINELMFSDELFKQYRPEWLQSGDFVAMTEWLQSIFAHPLRVELSDVRDIGSWRNRLRLAGVTLTYSSGTSGRMSFVPRDPMTWMALVRNSRSYADDQWWSDANGRQRPFDCLIAGPRGEGMGIQGAGVGLARLAARVHYLFDSAVTAGGVQALAERGWQPGSPATAAGDLECFQQARRFLVESAEARRPCLVFGAPSQVARLCTELLRGGGPLTLPSKSVVTTGGGWKNFHGERISRNRLTRLVESALGVDARRCIDAYGSSELNCTLISCPEHRYHIPPLVEPVVLDEAYFGQAGRTGRGALAFLDPFAMSYPGFFITGDTATLRAGECACGRHGWFLEGEIERTPGYEVKGCGGVLASTIA